MKEGSEEAFLRIYHENYNTLFCYGFGLTRDREFIKDCIQEMFLEIWNMRLLVNEDVQNVRSYLCTWLRRKMNRSKLREAKLKFGEGRRPLVSENNQLSYEDLLIAFQETEEKKERLARALGRLSRKQLEIIKLKFFENRSYAEIAVTTSLTTRTLYNTIFLAIQQLHKDISCFSPRI
jgi:RNA polymerase sigma factor (sigma-70 family)